MSVSPKIHPRLAAELEKPPPVLGIGERQLRIIVRHKPSPETRSATSAVDGVARVLRPYNRLVIGSAMVATPDAIRVLATRPDVEIIWLDEPVHTLLDVSVPLIEAPAVWSTGFTGKGIRVGVVDTGIDPDHPDFAGRILVNHDMTGEGARDNNGHGTHVSGIIGSSGVSSGGKYRGVAPGCSLLMVKVLKGDGSGFMSDVMAGLEFLVEQQAQVVNISIGGGEGSDGTDALSVACDSAVSQGITICVASGNSGPSSSTVSSPGCARTVVTVGATDKQDNIASYSSRGPTGDGRIKPDVCFPGSSIHSCRAMSTSMGQPVNDFYTTASGTSMASPHAAGVCALLLEAKPGLSPARIKEALQTTAKDLSLDPNTQGKGRGTAFGAYQWVVSTLPKPQPLPQLPPQPPQPQNPPPTQPPPPPQPLPKPPPAPDLPPETPPQPAPAPGGCFDLLSRFLRG